MVSWKVFWRVALSANPRHAEWVSDAAFDQNSSSVIRLPVLLSDYQFCDQTSSSVIRQAVMEVLLLYRFYWAMKCRN